MLRSRPPQQSERVITISGEQRLARPRPFPDLIQLATEYLQFLRQPQQSHIPSAGAARTRALTAGRRTLIRISCELQML